MAVWLVTSAHTQDDDMFRAMDRIKFSLRNVPGSPSPAAFAGIQPGADPASNLTWAVFGYRRDTDDYSDVYDYDDPTGKISQDAKTLLTLLEVHGATCSPLLMSIAIGPRFALICTIVS